MKPAPRSKALCHVPLTPNQLRQLRLRTAELSVGASTVRGMPKGTVKAAREALATVRLGGFSAGSNEAFVRRLDRETIRICKALPECSWGISRKVLNIYLRSCVYNAHLRRVHGLTRIEPWLEVPLDQQVAEGIQVCSGVTLPRFRNKNLKPDLSEEYQDAARLVARRVRCHPIHLEACWWRVCPRRCQCNDA